MFNIANAQKAKKSIKFLLVDNVSSISGVHNQDEAKLCNKSHFTNRANWD